MGSYSSTTDLSEMGATEPEEKCLGMNCIEDLEWAQKKSEIP